MLHADPWNEIERLEGLLDADVRAGLKRSEMRATAASFCAERCQVAGTCRLGHAIESRTSCPLFLYIEELTAAVVPDRLT